MVNKIDHVLLAAPHIAERSLVVTLGIEADGNDTRGGVRLFFEIILYASYLAYDNP